MATIHNDEPTYAPPWPSEIALRAPSAALAGLVSRIVGYRETSPGHFRQIGAASLDIPLVVSFGEPFAIGLGRAPGSGDRHGSFAAGLFAGPVTIDSFGASHCLQIDFTPLGARQFFRMPMTELANRMIALREVLGADGAALRDRLGDTDDWERRFNLAENFVLARMLESNPTSPEIAWAFERIALSGGRARVASIADGIGWSRKHLARRFAEEVGLGPKSISRIVRLNTAIALARTGEEGWAAIAAACGFADQAHLVREFRELAGASPVGFVPVG